MTDEKVVIITGASRGIGAAARKPGAGPMLGCRVSTFDLAAARLLLPPEIKGGEARMSAPPRVQTV